MKTKNNIKERILLSINLLQEAKKILNKVDEELDVHFITSEVFKTVLTDEANINTIMKQLEYEDMITNCPDGKERNVPEIIIRDPSYVYCVEIKQKVRGGSFGTCICEADIDSIQMCNFFELPDGSSVDLAMVEQIGNSLANTYNKPFYNQDLTIYVWDNPYQEDFSSKADIKYSDLAYVLLEDKLCELCDKYNLTPGCMSKEHLQKLAGDISIGDKNDEYTTNLITKELEKIHQNRVINSMAEWMVNLAKHDEESWVKEGSPVDDYIAWVYARVCDEDKSRREWWADFGLLDYELENIANDYNITWTDVFEADTQVYLVQYTAIDESTGSKIMNQYELCDYINMSNCHEDSYEIWDVTIPGMIRKCHYKGWQPNCLIEVIREDDGKVVVSLYGEDH